jgi:hypothetical protein
LKISAASDEPDSKKARRKAKEGKGQQTKGELGGGASVGEEEERETQWK